MGKKDSKRPEDFNFAKPYIVCFLMFEISQGKC